MHHLILLLIVAILGACESFDGEDETEIPLAEVPGPVMAAARQAVPGIEITEAEIEDEDGQKVYELSGEADGKRYEIEISGTGEILEVEEDR